MMFKITIIIIPGAKADTVANTNTNDKTVNAFIFAI